MFIGFNLVYSKNISYNDVKNNVSELCHSIDTTYLILNEEPYVDNIEFSTIDVVKNHYLFLDEESYVDDIDFDTECVVKQYMKNKQKLEIKST